VKQAALPAGRGPKGSAAPALYSGPYYVLTHHVCRILNCGHECSMYMPVGMKIPTPDHFCRR